MNQYEQEMISKVKSGSKIGGLILGGLILLMGAVTSVPDGHRGVRLRFSEAVSTEQPGLHLKLPLVESIKAIPVMADAVEVNNAEGATKDTQPVHTNLVVRYHIKPESVLTVYKEYSKEGNLDNYVFTSTLEAFKAVTARYDATELVSKRQDVSTATISAIQNKVSQYGVQVVSVDMTAFSFSGDYMKAINAKVTEEQQKLAEQNKLERVKVQEQQKVVVAQAEADAAIATAKGKAEATRLEAQALQQNNSLLELRRIEVAKIQAEKWNGKLPDTVMGNAVPMINLK